MYADDHLLEVARKCRVVLLTATCDLPRFGDSALFDHVSRRAG
jgi:hypothetical protein